MSNVDETGPEPTPQKIKVLYVVNGSTRTDTHECDTSSVQMAGAHSAHATVVEMRTADRHREVFYRHADKIEREKFQ